MDIFIFIFVALFSMFQTTFTPNAYVSSLRFTGDVVRDNMGMSWGNLPPSLKPPPEGGYPSRPSVDWG